MAYLGVLRGYFQGTGTMVPNGGVSDSGTDCQCSGKRSGRRPFVSDRSSYECSERAQNYSYALGAAGGTIGTGAGAATAFIFFVC